MLDAGPDVSALADLMPAADRWPSRSPTASTAPSLTSKFMVFTFLFEDTLAQHALHSVVDGPMFHVHEAISPYLALIGRCIVRGEVFHGCNPQVQKDRMVKVMFPCRLSNS